MDRNSKFIENSFISYSIVNSLENLDFEAVKVNVE